MEKNKMSIINSYDISSEAIIEPSMIASPVENFPETVVVTFQQETFNFMFIMDNVVQISELRAGRRIPIYKTIYKNKEIAFYHSLLGGSASGSILEEIIVQGGKKILFFGSCGSLDKNISAGHYIIPTDAYRDEGTSYHYMPPSDYIKIKTADSLSNLFDEINIPHIKAKTWTTDSFYRETKNKMLDRKKDGCLAVEMECASVMAVGQFRNVNVYQFLYASDSLDAEEWDPRILGNMPDDMRESHLHIAFEIAYRL